MAREINANGVYLLHVSQTVGARRFRGGWTVVTDNGRLQDPRYINRRNAIRLFQHAASEG